ncbi:Uu.00g037250.m01.CDS01 [Anthostomella pinea]|uniref:Uu.00g037250.m01.CDS01 n=1 Tax=Anthostomella pinea TaxID=933095 RepID=A0AAI8VA36_9PEZI|nr:Uu.00g037250.m01.CDS01 [Anthostomella pinea]
MSAADSTESYEWKDEGIPSGYTHEPEGHFIARVHEPDPTPEEEEFAFVVQPPKKVKRGEPFPWPVVVKVMVKHGRGPLHKGLQLKLLVEKIVAKGREILVEGADVENDIFVNIDYAASPMSFPMTEGKVKEGNTQYTVFSMSQGINLKRNKFKLCVFLANLGFTGDPDRNSKSIWALSHEFELVGENIDLPPQAPTANEIRFIKNLQSFENFIHLLPRPSSTKGGLLPWQPHPVLQFPLRTDWYVPKKCENGYVNFGAIIVQVRNVPANVVPDPVVTLSLLVGQPAKKRGESDSPEPNMFDDEVKYEPQRLTGTVVEDEDQAPYRYAIFRRLKLPVSLMEGAKRGGGCRFRASFHRYDDGPVVTWIDTPVLYRPDKDDGYKNPLSKLLPPHPPPFRSPHKEQALVKILSDDKAFDWKLKYDDFRGPILNFAKWEIQLRGPTNRDSEGQTEAAGGHETTKVELDWTSQSESSFAFYANESDKDESDVGSGYSTEIPEGSLRQ